MIMPLRSGYDRQLLFEHIANRVRRDPWVDVTIDGERWRAQLVGSQDRLSCTGCGDGLTIAHASGKRRLCTRCRSRALH
jgi:hypothetical protein